MVKMNTQLLEHKVATFFGIRTNLIVPNVWWGLGLNYEADLVVLRPSMWAIEIELKISKSDIKADNKKWHSHESKLFRHFYYAVPCELENCEYLPKEKGLISVDLNRKYDSVKIIRPSKINKNARKLTDNEYLILLRLCSMLVWSLKERLIKK